MMVLGKFTLLYFLMGQLMALICLLLLLIYNQFRGAASEQLQTKMNTNLTDYERAYLRMLLNNKIKELQLLLENRHLIQLQEHIGKEISELITMKEKLTYNGE